MTATVPSLLQPLKDRLAAQLPDAARMDAYYYGFQRTGFQPVDAILSAVAVAGKGSHHTESWAGTDSAWFYGDRPGLPAADGAEDLIQKTADLAARNITTDQAKLIAAIEAVVALHGRGAGHNPECDCGIPAGANARCLCGKDWPCPTVAALTQALGGDTA